MADKNERRGGILGDFSLSQVVATGLAAAVKTAAMATAIGAKLNVFGTGVTERGEEERRFILILLWLLESDVRSNG